MKIRVRCDHRHEAPADEPRSRVMHTTRKLAVVLALVLGHSTRGAGQQPTASAQQQMARDLLTAMNARDTVALRRFVDAHFVTSGPGVPAPAVRVERLLTIRSNLGQLEFQRADTGGPNEFF